MQASTAVDVVIVTYNSAGSLEECVRRARGWASTRQVIVVDNASSDDSARVAEGVADRVIRSGTNRGFGAGQNIGIAAAECEWVMILNPDAEVLHEGLDAGLSVLAADSEVAMVEGVIRTRQGDVERWCGSEPGLRALVARSLRLREKLGVRRLQRLSLVIGRRDYVDRIPAEPTAVEFLAAVAPLARRSALLGVGGFDEDIFLYAEDIDLCRRLRSGGWSLLALPVEWAIHAGGVSSAGRPAFRDRAWWQSHRVFVQKHWTGPRRWLGLALTARELRKSGSRA